MKCLVDLPFDVLLEVLQRIGKGEETDRKNAARWVANSYRLLILSRVCKSLRDTVEPNWKEYTADMTPRQLSLVRDLAAHFSSKLSIRVKDVQVPHFEGPAWGYTIRIKLGVYPAFKQRHYMQEGRIVTDWKPRRHVYARVGEYGVLDGVYHPFETADSAGGPLDPEACGEDTYWCQKVVVSGSMESRFGYRKASHMALVRRLEFCISTVEVFDETTDKVVLNDNRGNKYYWKANQLVMT